MAERKRSTRKQTGGGSSTEDRVTRGRQKAEHDLGLLDNPDLEEEPSEIRHTLYFAGVLVFGIALNLVAMLIVSGGR